MRSHVRIVSGARINATSHGSNPVALCLLRLPNAIFRSGSSVACHEYVTAAPPVSPLSLAACSRFLAGATKERADVVAGLDVLPLRDVVVGIHRDAGLRVAQPLAHDLDVVPRLEHQAGIGVALVVDADARHAGLLDPAVIVAGEIAGLDRRANVGWEDQIVILPQIPQQKPPLVLPGLDRKSSR